MSAAVVAAAWAMIAGWMRVVGQVTPVMTGIDSVTCDTAPRVAQTKGEFPCRSTQGLSLIHISEPTRPY